MKKLLFALALFAPLSAVPAAFTTQAYAASSSTTALGDLSLYEGIAVDTLGLVRKGDMVAAEKRITDFETAWDDAQPKMRPLNVDQWGFVDDAADVAIGALRADKPVAADAETAVTGLIAALQNPAGK